jgi:hypothetical protein
VATLSVERGVTDNAIFRSRSYRTYGYTELYWNGPGSGLKLMLGQMLISIEHRTADGTYQTFREAREAARAFFTAVEQED